MDRRTNTVEEFYNFVTFCPEARPMVFIRDILLVVSRTARNIPCTHSFQLMHQLPINQRPVVPLEPWGALYAVLPLRQNRARYILLLAALATKHDGSINGDIWTCLPLQYCLLFLLAKYTRPSRTTVMPVTKFPHDDPYSYQVGFNSHQE